MKKISSYVLVIAVSVVIFLADLVLAPKADGSLLVALLFWAAVGQGIIALVAAADLSKAKWIDNIRPYMQAFYPLLLLFPAAFLIFGRHVSVYGWTEHPNAWLEPTFFIVRNVVALLLPFVFARFYVQASRKGSEKTGMFAVLYIAFFVISQSFMAFDQVMTFEYPWINTLFGGFFFVESLFAGMAFCAIMAGFMMKRDAGRFKEAFDDFTLMVMGFALLWAGLFFSQYLVIWYGNIPEELSFVSKRMDIGYIRNMGIYSIFVLFLVPFLGLVPRKVKASFPAVSFIALLVFSGLIVERLVYLIPVAHLSVIAVALHMVLLGVPFIYLMFTHKAAVSPAA